jgi:hypothetical protein
LGGLGALAERGLAEGRLGLTGLGLPAGWRALGALAEGRLRLA